MDHFFNRAQKSGSINKLRFLSTLKGQLFNRGPILVMIRNFLPINKGNEFKKIELADNFILIFDSVFVHFLKDAAIGSK